MLDRFYLDDPLLLGSTPVLEGDEFHHAARVHRTRVGDRVELFDGRGRIVLATVTSIGARAMELAVDEDVREPREAAVRLELGVALIQPEKFELVLQKATELGVDAILPLTSERTEVRLERIAGKRERWEKILLEAAKQSGRGLLPRLGEPRPLREALQDAVVTVVLDPAGEPAPPEASPVRLLVGPEGGWSEEDMAAARAAGAVLWSLGPRRLRAETAAIAGAALLLLRGGAAGAIRT